LAGERVLDESQLLLFNRVHVPERAERSPNCNFTWLSNTAQSVFTQNQCLSIRHGLAHRLNPKQRFIRHDEETFRERRFGRSIEINETRLAPECFPPTLDQAISQWFTGEENAPQRRQLDWIFQFIQPALRQRRNGVQDRNLFALEPLCQLLRRLVDLRLGQTKRGAAGEWQEDVSQDYVER